MARFEVLRLGDGLVVDVQTDYIIGLNTRLVIPLDYIERVPKRTPRLNPAFEIDGRRYVLITQEMSSISAKWLVHRVGSLASRADDITEAIDVLLTGF